MSVSHIYTPVATTDSTPDRHQPMAHFDFSISPKGVGFISLWSLIAIGCLVASNILYMVSLLTIGWGTVDVTLNNGNIDHWEFGLWQCCRESDGLCIGPRWPSKSQ